MNTATADNATLQRGGVRHTTIDPGKLWIKDGWNSRFDWGDILGLSKEIEAQLKLDPSNGGLLNDLRVKKIEKGHPMYGKGVEYEVVDGERRTRALSLALKRGVVFPHGVGAKVVPKDQTELQSLIQMYAANGGKPFLPLEEARFFQRLRDMEQPGGKKLSWADIAKLVGKSVMHINNTVALLEAAPEVQQALEKGEVTATAAKAIATSAKGDAAAQKELLGKAKQAKGKGKEAAKARTSLKKDVQKRKQTKAAARGRKLKDQFLDEASVHELGQLLAGLLARKAHEAAFKQYDAKDMTKLLEHIKKDEKLVMAFTCGALQAVKVVAGVEGVELDI